MRNSLDWMGPLALALLVACGTAADSSEPDKGSVADTQVAEGAQAVATSSKGSASPEAGSSKLTVLFTNNIDGEIEPCG